MPGGRRVLVPVGRVGVGRAVLGGVVAGAAALPGADQPAGAGLRARRRHARPAPQLPFRLVSISNLFRMDPP